MTLDKPAHPNPDNVSKMVNRLIDVANDKYGIKLTHKQIQLAKSITFSFPIGQKGRNDQTYELSLYDLASSSYQDLLDNDRILNQTIQANINEAYALLKDDIGIDNPEHHFKLFKQAFKYTTVCFNNFKNTDIIINTRSYNCLINTQLYHFNPDLSHLANLLDYHLLVQTPYNELLSIDGIGPTTADHIVGRLHRWSKNKGVTDYDKLPLFQHL